MLRSLQSFQLLLCLLAARALDEVGELPGFGVPMQRTLSGYVEVNSSSNGHLYYMFFEKLGSKGKSAAPLLIWLNGGPGASSALGNFLEHGPYRLQANGSLVKNPSTWNNLAHLLYFDQPVGTGYSYCNEGGYVTNMAQLSAQFTTGLRSFYKRHPEYMSSPLYLSGESYAGVYVPAITAYILEKAPDLQISGVLIGNPGNFHYSQYFGQIEFAQSHALIGDEEATEALRMWQECQSRVQAKDMVAAFHKCEDMSSYIFSKAGNPFLYNIEQWGDMYDDVLAPVMEKYFADERVKSLLHAGRQVWKNGDGTSAPNPVVNALDHTLMDSVLPDLKSILDRGVTLRMYNGVLDGSSCNHISHFNALKLLDWSGKDAFFKAPRKQWRVKGSNHAAGYVKTGGGLSFVWVANSGHLVPSDQPEAALQLLEDFFDSIVSQEKLSTEDAATVLYS